MELKARECPHCHRMVSIKTCSTYFLRGTAYHIRCNHCNAELALINEPVPFKWCPLIGYMSTVIPAVYFLFVRKFGFVESMSYAAIIGLLAVVTIAILTIEKCYFKVV